MPRRRTLILLLALLPACTTEPAPKKPYITKSSTAPDPPAAPAAPQTPATPGPAAPQSPPTALDPCADNLHVFAGLLLKYYLLHQELPPDLDTLVKISSFPDPAPSLTCPVAKEKYLYNPAGPALQGAGRLMIYDATPAHDGSRWGVAVREPTSPTTPLTATVISVPAAALAAP